MAYNWDRRYHDVGIAMQPRIVRVDNDAALNSYLSNGKRKAALALSRKIIDNYEEEYGEKLQISARSLACEIYDHYLILKITAALAKLFGEDFRPLRWMKRHMDVIDCGEKKEDNNRFLWDLFSLFWITSERPS